MENSKTSSETLITYRTMQVDYSLVQAAFTVKQKASVGFSYTSTLTTVKIYNRTTGACYGH